MWCFKETDLSIQQTCQCARMLLDTSAIPCMLTDHGVEMFCTFGCCLCICSAMGVVKQSTSVPQDLHHAWLHPISFEWSPIKKDVHHAESHRPFELFVNENHKLQNEAKMNATFERGSARDPSAQSSLSLLRWTMLLREESAHQLHSLLWLCVTTTARVVPSRTKRLPDVVGRVHCTAVIPHRRLVLDAVLSDLLHCLWRVGPVATRSMRWRAQLPWMSHDWNESCLRMLCACPVLGIAFSPITSVSSECKNAKLKAWNNENWQPLQSF